MCSQTFIASHQDPCSDFSIYLEDSTPPASASSETMKVAKPVTVGSQVAEEKRATITSWYKEINLDILLKCNNTRVG